MRGRKPGQGKFTGGRPKTSPNKKGKFETSLPPVRCSEALKAYYEDNARAAGMDLSTYLREVLTSIKSNGEQVVAKENIMGAFSTGYKNAVAERIGGRALSAIKIVDFRGRGDVYCEEEYKKGFAAGEVAEVNGDSYIDENGAWMSFSSGWPWGKSDKYN